jgi:O-antigen/teichoic acid export membrane protein
MASIAVSTPAPAKAVVTAQIRGSGLLIIGKMLSVGITSLAQVMIVRHLTTAEYGSFAYALAVVMLWQSISNCGLHEAIARFFPIYHDRKDYSRLFGTIFLSLGMILITGGAVIAMFFLRPEWVLHFVHEQVRSLDCLFILIFLVPLEALDALLMGVFASLSSAKVIFYRRHVVAPGLKLAAVVGMLTLRRGAVFLAYGYLLASSIGLVWYGWVLIRQMQEHELLSKFRLGELRFPFRDVFSFTLPMMTSDLVSMLNQSAVVIILGYYFGMKDVALLRAVIPAAAINGMVAVTCALLYLPAASRLFADDERAGLQELYWRTAAWIAVLSFPIFTITFCFARPLTMLLFGARYAQSGTILAVLSVGYYFDTVFGFNGLTLKAANRMGCVVACNIGAAVATVILSFVLIPRYGALGAAIAVAASLSVLGILKQIAMIRTVGIRFSSEFVSLYRTLGTAMAFLLVLHVIASRNLYVGAVLATFTVCCVFLIARKELNISNSFPEIARLPLLGRILA